MFDVFRSPDRAPHRSLTIGPWLTPILILGWLSSTWVSSSGCQRGARVEEANANANANKEAAAEPQAKTTAREGQIAAEVGAAAQQNPPTTPDPELPGLPSAGADDAAAEKLRARLEAALAAKGADYVPRTEHHEADGRPKFINRLIESTSPYLLQHAHNPVNWYPWGPAAFARAQREGKPVLLSVGYSTCHWCHVMERESFENLEIASFINANFIAIKVDREERPDVDDVYMAAVQRLTGHGGWPMTVMMTADGQPFFGGTYFPPFDGARGVRKGFMTILREMSERFKNSPNKIFEQAAELSRQLDSDTRRVDEALPGAESIARAHMLLRRRHDTRWGGFGPAPKFPRPATLDLLLRWHRRTKDEFARTAVVRTVDAMIDGGIHDHVGGGFHRYSTDAQWLVPHFEKMLYDNAQLAVTLIDLYQITDDPRYAATARSTLDYLLRDMSDPSGGFRSATDAESPVPGRPSQREEGWFFTWTPEELNAALGPKLGQTFARVYGVTPEGNFEGRSILHIEHPLARHAQREKVKVSVLAQRLESARAELYSVRAKRPPPLLDDRVLCSWNGLMLSALARAGFVLDVPEYRTRAVELGNWLLRGMRDRDGRLSRSARGGQLGGRGFLDDYAFTIQGLLDLFEAHPDSRWLEGAIELQAIQDRFHADDAGGYFMTASDTPKLLVRQKPSYDGAEPSGNSVALGNLHRLAEWTDKQVYRDRAQALTRFFASDMARRPTSVPKMLSGLDWALDSPLQIFIISPDPTDPAAAKRNAVEAALVAELRSAFLPNRIVQILTESEVEKHARLVPALAGKKALRGRPTAYVCENQVCQLPTSKAEVFAQQLTKIHGYDLED